MKLPNKCLHCKRTMMDKLMGKDTEHRAYWIQRTELDYDSDLEDRIDDQIWECSTCHTLFRLRWKLISFIELVEKNLNLPDESLK